MSSFLHSPRHFNSVENAIIELKKKSNSEFFSDFLYNVSDREIKTVMDGIRELSVNSVFIQYKNHYENIDNEISNNISDIMNNKTQMDNLSPIGLFKAINSILYQIELNTIKQTREVRKAEQDCYNRLIDFKNEISEYIVSNLAEYNEVKTWSIH
jgi:dipeptidase